MRSLRFGGAYGLTAVRFHQRWFWHVFVFLALCSASLSHVSGQVSVLTQHNDNARTGQNLNETILNTSNVNTATFGKLFTRKVDGQVYTQPLYVPNVTIPGVGPRNVFYVATMHDSVYAFDADDPNANAPYWQVSFIDPANNILSIPYTDVAYARDIDKEIGVTSTPVIDPTSGTLYCVSKRKRLVGKNWVYEHHLHALDIATGAEKFGGPTLIQASVPGKGESSKNGVLSFIPMRQLQRPALTLLNGVVYLAFGSHADVRPYHGWLMAYDAQTLQQLSVFCTTPNGIQGGIWQAGQGMAVDADNFLYCITGNGTFSADKNGSDYGNSFLKFSTQNGLLSLVDYFTPHDQADLESWDGDLGSSGPHIIPEMDRILGGGKDGRLFVLDMEDLGEYHEGDDNHSSTTDDPQIVQWFWAFAGHLHGTPVQWNSPEGLNLYAWSENDWMKVFRVQDGKLQTPPVMKSAMQVPHGMPGGFMSISANGSTPGTGVLWVSHPYNMDANQNTVPGILRAFDASTLQELWNSKMLPERDDFGNHAKYVAPTVANGKVYQATFSNQIAVYGLGKWVATPVITSNNSKRGDGGTVTITCSTPGARILYTTDGSDPDKGGRPYKSSFSLQNCTLVKARAYLDGYIESPLAQTAAIFDKGPGNGDGLRATFFTGKNFTGDSFTRTDPFVNFNWGGKSPMTGIGNYNWSARWTGWIEPVCTAVYTFTTASDDGVRLWIGNNLIIDDWNIHQVVENSAQISLVAGRKYPIKLEYFQAVGGSTLSLYWSTLGMSKQIIPTSQLSSGYVQAPSFTPNGGDFNPSQTVTLNTMTPDATITYTLDGSEPTASSAPYTGPFTLTDTTTVKAKAFKSGLMASDTTTVTFNRNLDVGTIRINAGGNKAGKFSADNYFSGGNAASRPNTIDTSGVPNPAPAAVYQSERWSADSFAYTLPNLIPGGSYLVRLHFAEIAFNAAGQRLFNITLNGANVLTNFDIFATAGGKNKALVREFTTTADANGNLVIGFQNVQGGAKISALEAIPQ